MPDNDNAEDSAQHDLPGDGSEMNAAAGDPATSAAACESTGKKDVGGGEGGADADGPGNILAGVQPTNEKDGDAERRHD